MTSPAHRQYLDLKAQHPDAILLFRMGDFYEMFGDDAVAGAETLQITLTSREFARGERVAMAGFPHHALPGYLKRFVDNGLKVAVCEQLTEAGKGLVERGVVRVVTPGTLVEPALLTGKQNNYLVAVNPRNEVFGLAYVDVTTGEFAVTEFSGSHAVADLEAELRRLDPAECIVPQADLQVSLAGQVTVHDAHRFQLEGARRALCEHFGVRTLAGFGCDEMPAAIGAAGGIVTYVERADRQLLSLLRTLHTYIASAYMVLDSYTRRNLELTESTRGSSNKGTLLWVLDVTRTAMGGRLLRRWIGQPLLSAAPLNARLDAVAELHSLPVRRSQLRQLLPKVGDIERLAARVCQGSASGGDLLALGESLKMVPAILGLLGDAGSDELQRVRDALDPCEDVTDLIECAIEATVESHRERRIAVSSDLIRSGYSPELDAMKASIAVSRTWIADLEPAEQSRTGIRSLKVGYNKVFGYYLEISHANARAVPTEYIRKQTLVNAERYITPELKEHEARILQAGERIGVLEQQLFAQVLETVALQVNRLSVTANALAHSDAYCSFAEVAARRRYARPDLTGGDAISIYGGRHPVVEASIEDQAFISNDCVLDCSDQQVLLLTGPNMGGKSTYLRQVALIVLMAQIGSFVPADEARIGLVDRIFTRVGAQDDIAAGQSTFMVEMVETANILNHATRASLLILDEVGRGTSTYDGLAIAQSVLAYIHDQVGARTLFATHYHELTALADRVPRIYNVSMAVTEDRGNVIFLHHVVPGGADRSYGIHVARLAGLPETVTSDAQEILRDLEQTDRGNGRRRQRTDEEQLAFFANAPESLASQVLDDVLALDLPNLTPMEAMARLHELQMRGKQE